MVGGRMLISADDGDADLDEPDNLYVADLRDGKSYATVLPFRSMADFRRPGEIEGLAVDPATDDLLVLANRGARIVLGMPRGFYPGYDGEVARSLRLREGEIDEYGNAPLWGAFSIPCRKLRPQDSRPSKFFSIFSPI